MDVVSPEIRSRMMQGIRSKDTLPEFAVRSCAHGLGLRFRLHDRKLPGRPDLVFARHSTVIFVNGCFWHRHTCRWTSTPKTRPEFWQAKFAANQARDAIKRAELEMAGWRVIVVWECETRDEDVLRLRLARLFGLDGHAV